MIMGVATTIVQTGNGATTVTWVIVVLCLCIFFWFRNLHLKLHAFHPSNPATLAVLYVQFKSLLRHSPIPHLNIIVFYLGR